MSTYLRCSCEIDTYDTVVQCVANPQPELRPREERVALAKHVELWVPVEDTGGDELVEDTDNERREDGEHDVIERKRP